MRKLAIGAVVSGALALTGLAAPSALADTPHLTFGAVTVNNGKPIVADVKDKVTVPVTYSFTRPSDLVIDNENTFMGVALYRGRLASPSNTLEASAKQPVCTTTATTDTTVTQSCTTKITVDPREHLMSAADATTWKVAAILSRTSVDEDDSDDHIGFENGFDIWGNLGTAKLQRAAKLTVNATPEPVAKGRTLTVKGALTRANWETGRHSGYRDQKVTLQFKAKGATAYADVKTVTSGTGGALSTTVKALKDGSYRYTFAGTSTTAAKTSAGDHVDVR
ncbi:hypothetical protein [Streptomyces sp. HM190]|uniref:hypothetical protein n=1 Tax=Streptomyces sp. HM190 TaxID=2695266 RepID=UPI00135ABE58|nr:hypothetical protein [Streptomyces sp. HM190]